jgi:uncharacterized membrane protein YccC
MIACALGIILIYLIGMPNALWVVVTIIVIMCAQIYVGGVMQKAMWRFAGTLCGCGIAAASLIFFGATPTSILLTTGLSVFIFSYFAAGHENAPYAATLGAATTAIIMLGHPANLTLAAERFFEISTGVLIAAVVSQFIFPIHASTHLKRVQSRTIALLRDYYQMMIMAPALSTHLINFHEQEEEIVKLLLKQRQLAKESRTEPFKHSFNLFHFTQLLYSEREILRAITFMHQAFFHLKDKNILINMQFNEAIIQALDKLSKKIGAEKPTQSIYIPSFDDLRNEFSVMLKHASQDEALYINGYLFSAETLLLSLTKIISLQAAQ